MSLLEDAAPAAQPNDHTNTYPLTPARPPKTPQTPRGAGTVIIAVIAAIFGALAVLIMVGLVAVLFLRSSNSTTAAGPVFEQADFVEGPVAPLAPDELLVAFAAHTSTSTAAYS